MIYFVLDACALARIYVPDIGTRNLLQIRDYPDNKLVVPKRISPLLKTLGGRVILVTSDGALYDSALAEPEIEAFHFWTCDMGCQCGSEVIPVKGKPKVPNSCPSCGQTCPECRYDLCPSTYRVHF